MVPIEHKDVFPAEASPVASPVASSRPVASPRPVTSLWPVALAALVVISAAR